MQNWQLRLRALLHVPWGCRGAEFSGTGPQAPSFHWVLPPGLLCSGQGRLHTSVHVGLPQQPPNLYLSS